MRTPSPLSLSEPSNWRSFVSAATPSMSTNVGGAAAPAHAAPTQPPTQAAFGFELAKTDVAAAAPVHFDMAALWQFYDLPYGREFALTAGRGGAAVRVYFAPCLSAIQLYSADGGEEEGAPPSVAFEYFETNPPTDRPPLKDKVDELALLFPPLFAGSSAAFHRSSWFCVLWNPIYAVPAVPNSGAISRGMLYVYTHLAATARAGETPDQSGCKLEPLGLGTSRIDATAWQLPSLQLEQLERLLSERGVSLSDVHPDAVWFQAIK